MNKDFNRWIKSRRPYVTVKVAQSLDGKIATKRGESRWISGARSRALVHELRANADAILVGVNTVLKDNPRLSARPVRNHAQPLKVILDSTLRCRPGAKIFSKASPGKTLIAATEKAPRSRFRLFKNKAEIALVKRDKKGHVDLAELMKLLGKRGVVNVLIEGGGEVIADAVGRKLADEFYCFIAPILIGGRMAKNAVAGEGINLLKKAAGLRGAKVRWLGKDLLYHGYLK